MVNLRYVLFSNAPTLVHNKYTLHTHAYFHTNAHTHTFTYAHTHTFTLTYIKTSYKPCFKHYYYVADAKESPVFGRVIAFPRRGPGCSFPSIPDDVVVSFTHFASDAPHP